MIDILLETPLDTGGKTLDLDVIEAYFPEMSTFEGLGGLPEDEVNFLERPVVEGLLEAKVCLLERPVVEALPEAEMFLLAEMFLPERPVVEGLHCILELNGSSLQMEFLKVPPS